MDPNNSGSRRPHLYQRHQQTPTTPFIQQGRTSTPPPSYPAPLNPPTSKSSETVPSSNTSGLHEYLVNSAYLNGVCSDVTIRAFGKSYALHKLILWRAGFFKGLFEARTWMNDNYFDNEKEEEEEEEEEEEREKKGNEEMMFKVKLDDVSNITKESFEHVIGFLYCGSLEQHSQIHTSHKSKSKQDQLRFIISVIATASYLAVPFEVSTHYVTLLLRQINSTTISTICRFASSNDYGADITGKILESCRGWLCSFGWSDPDRNRNDWERKLKLWSELPHEVISDVISSDLFYVKGEFERCCFVIEIIRYLESRANDDYGQSSDIDDDDDDDDGDDDSYDEDFSVLYEILNRPGSIIYLHMTPAQLHHLESLKNMKGSPYIFPGILKDAFWKAFRLCKIITSATPEQKDLNLTITGTYDANSSVNEEEQSYVIPVKDETIYDTPSSLYTRFINSNRIEQPEQNVCLHKLSTFPPYRFSVQFSESQLRSLPCDKRIYSQTIWYAGSHWNLYVQKIKTKKGTYQMGVYLHRAVNSGGNPANLNAGRISDIRGLTRDISCMSLTEDQADPGDITRLTQGAPLSDDQYEDDQDQVEDEEDEEQNMKSTPSQDQSQSLEDSYLRYADPRSEIQTYYKIHTPTNPSVSSSSSSGKRKKSTQPNSITCFVSTPDGFNRSQSWGWKSNSMCEFDEQGNVVLGDQENVEREETELRFMICLGLV